MKGIYPLISNENEMWTVNAVQYIIIVKISLRPVFADIPSV